MKWVFMRWDFSQNILINTKVVIIILIIIIIIIMILPDLQYIHTTQKEDAREPMEANKT